MGLSSEGKLVASWVGSIEQVGILNFASMGALVAVECKSIFSKVASNEVLEVPDSMTALDEALLVVAELDSALVPDEPRHG